MEAEQTVPQSPDSRDAYLVVREGNSWRDIFRLSPTQVMTIGRATTNRIVLRDELCSRNHCELYRNGSTWVVRDLGSRNGTTVNAGPVVGERELESGDLIQIGPYELGFTFNLGEPFPQKEPKPDINESDTAFSLDVVDPKSASSGHPEIVHRARSSRYRMPETVSVSGPDRTQSELASLYRLALDMGAAGGAKELAEVVLTGLRGGINFDIGAVLLLPKAVAEGGAGIATVGRRLQREGREPVSHGVELSVDPGSVDAGSDPRPRRAGRRPDLGARRPRRSAGRQRDLRANSTRPADPRTGASLLHRIPSTPFSPRIWNSPSPLPIKWRWPCEI